MYRYFFVISLTLFKLNACEFMDGGIIEDPKVSQLFKTVVELYKDDKVTSATIENLYDQYVCLLANKDKRDARPLSDAHIISLLHFLIKNKKNQR